MIKTGQASTPGNSRCGQTVADESVTPPAALPGLESVDPTAPVWFKRAIETRPEDRFVQVAGCPIHYLRWGKTGKPGLMLVHGGFAHAHWWDFIAPLFLEEYCVAAVDLSGMGDSGHRPKYTGELFAKEVMAVCVDAGFSNRPFVAGHSFGGYVALQAGALYGQDLGGIVMVDFPIRPPELQRQHEASRPLVRKKEIYPQLENALARFRLIPEQPCDNRFILQHIARHSIAQVQGGWAWKFDDQVFSDFELGNIRENVEKISCPMAVIYGDQSALFPPEVIDYMTGLLAPRIPMVALAGAHHHLFLEQPLAFVETLRNLLKRWHHP